MARSDDLKAELPQSEADFTAGSRRLPFLEKEVKRERSKVENQRRKIKLLEEEYARKRQDSLQFRILEQEAILEDVEKNVKKQEKEVVDLRVKLATLRERIDMLPTEIRRAVQKEKEASIRTERQRAEAKAQQEAEEKWRKKWEERERKRKEREEKQRRYDKSDSENKKRKFDDSSDPETPPRATQAARRVINLSAQPTIPQWRQACDTVFASYKDTTNFPAPPVSFMCRNAACAGDGPLFDACSCNIRAAINSLPGLNLKKERVKWHPDRFAGVDEKKREVWQKMANEMFVAIGNMIEGTRPNKWEP